VITAWGGIYLSIDLAIHLVFWIMGFLLLLHIPLCQSRGLQATDRPSVSIIIPARNEEQVLPALLISLKGQLGPKDEIIVVNDNSDDDTAIVAERLGARVILSGGPPQGWTGKPWACYQGVKAAARQLFLFLDADTVLEKDGLERILATSMDHAGVLSVQPYHRMHSAYEQLSAFFNIVLMAAMGSFSILGRTIGPIGLFGPVMVFTRHDYLRSGGFYRVRNEILEDLALGIELKNQNIRLHCYGGRHTVSFRMYPNGLRQVIAGWGKGFSIGAAKTSVPILLMVVAWISGALGIMRNLAEAMAAFDSLQMLLWGALYVLFASQIYWMLFRIGNFRIVTALLFPIPLLFFLTVFFYSIFLVFLRRKVEWKGRTIDLEE
jgi:4,4'-diaponeurosporenoate glycosyltransferase